MTGRICDSFVLGSSRPVLAVAPAPKNRSRAGDTQSSPPDSISRRDRARFRLLAATQRPSPISPRSATPAHTDLFPAARLYSPPPATLSQDLPRPRGIARKRGRGIGRSISARHTGVKLKFRRFHFSPCAADFASPSIFSSLSLSFSLFVTLFYGCFTGSCLLDSADFCDRLFRA